MEKRKSKVIACLAVWIITIFSIFVSISCVDDKCGACNAVAEELELGLSNCDRISGPHTLWLGFIRLCGIKLLDREVETDPEKPRNHLDMRHRLDSTGQRRGKVIDYRVSELRVVELLDGLCEKMQEYTLEKIGSTREWIKVVDWNILSIDKQEARVHSKHLFLLWKFILPRLLEETEDELTELIKKGSIKSGDVSKVLCQDLSKHCDKTRASQQLDAENDDLDKEL
ncbi:hypothetical protein C5167_038701 [Papaver somniferum]|uniref:DUF3456 domain-containing protein n=1 Tax=Papaver somniferum TaxID=3469 RepID=A0A4Y7IDE6_PAPSO|nr:hypothetical protein C5167_038701 [Papaver somniferum]